MLPDSRLAATVGYDRTMRVWQVANGKQVCSGPAPRTDAKSANHGNRRNLAFTPDSRHVIFDAAGVLAMADSATGMSAELPGGLKGLAEVPPARARSPWGVVSAWALPGNCGAAWGWGASCRHSRSGSSSSGASGGARSMICGQSPSSGQGRS